MRGIGVAVMTSRCGTVCPVRDRSSSRWRTPNRCCSSTTTRPRSAKPTPSWITAWVPTTIPAAPDCTSSSAARRSLAESEPVRSTIRVARSLVSSSTGADPSSSAKSAAGSPARPSGPSIARSDRACWAASTSVGASSTVCRPASTTCSIARRATTVLPDPTSPCSSRLSGRGAASASARSAPTFCCPAVSAKGSRASNAAASPSSTRGQGGAGRSDATSFSPCSTSCRASASSQVSRRIAGFVSSSVAGRWMSRSARPSPTRPWRVRISSGTGSSGSSNTSRVWRTAASRSQVWTFRVAG